ncbi:MAG: dienelactone hydrolase family protein [Candidatus Poribacteria bacterium]
MTAESFIDLLENYGIAHPPSMVYRDGDDFAQWQIDFRAKVESLRGPLPERVEPTVEIVESVETDDHTRHLLRIPVSDISTLLAYLLLPHGLDPDERRPGIIACHGHATYGIDSICGVRGIDESEARESDDARRAYALSAVRAGYVVIAPAWWGWAGRDGHLDRIGNRDKCNVIQMAAAMYGMNVLDLHIQDGQAALDVLAARPEVDPKRLGCLGNSYGGRMTMWLAIFDERIKACIPAGCMNIFRERSLKLSSCGIQYLPGILRYGDVPELFCLIAPRPMQLQVGEQDSLITPEDRDMIETTVRRAYHLLNAEDNFSYARHPEGHLLLWNLAAPFLKVHLGAS